MACAAPESRQLDSNARVTPARRAYPAAGTVEDQRRRGISLHGHRLPSLYRARKLTR